MTNILVRDLPDDVHAALVGRAKLRGQSLQQYVAAQLSDLVQRPSREELLDRIERRSGGAVGFEQAADDLSGARARD